MKNLDTFLDNSIIWKSEKYFIKQEEISNKTEKYFKKSEKKFPCGSGRKLKQCCGK